MPSGTPVFCGSNKQCLIAIGYSPKFATHCDGILDQPFTQRSGSEQAKLKIAADLSIGKSLHDISYGIVRNYCIGVQKPKVWRLGEFCALKQARAARLIRSDTLRTALGAHFGDICMLICMAYHNHFNPIVC